MGTLGTPAAFFKCLADKGVKLLEFNPVDPPAACRGQQANQRNHQKLSVVDGQTAFLNSVNVSGVYPGGSFGYSATGANDAGQSWRDTDLQIKRPAIAELQKLFLAV